MSLDPTCVGCGAPFVRSTGRRYSRCVHCSWDYQRLYLAMGRRNGQCVCCNTKLPPHHSKFCSLACRVQPVGAAVPCMTCGLTFVRDGRLMHTCSDACRDEAKRERYRRKNRRRRTKTEPGTYTVRQLAERDGCRCHLCGRKVDMGRSGMAKWGPTIDHLVPLSAGGTDTLQNVALAHRYCNISRQHLGAAQLRLVG